MLRSEYMARQPEHLRGIFSMGSFLVKNSTVLKQPRVASDDSRSDLPILMMHGAFKFPVHVKLFVLFHRNYIGIISSEIWSLAISFLILSSVSCCTSIISFLWVRNKSQADC